MGEPVLVYDDDCGFCTWWADFLRDRAEFPIVGFSELTPSLRDRLPSDYESCSHFVTDEAVYSCGASIEEAVLRSDLGRRAQPLVDRLRAVSVYVRLREWVYQRIAHNRGFWGAFMSKTPPARKRVGED